MHLILLKILQILLFECIVDIYLFLVIQHCNLIFGEMYFYHLYFFWCSIFFNSFEQVLKEQKNEINKYVEQINNLTSKYNEIKKENNIFKLKYETKIKELNIQIQINNDKIQKLSNENNQNKEKVNKQINETIELKENLKKKEKELSDLNGEKESMIKSFKRIDNIQKENEDLKKQNLELKEIEKKVDKLENVIKNSSTKDDFLTKSGEQFYDVVIDIDSINALKYKGWEINYNEERKEIYEKIINEETIKIGVLGF